MREGEMRETDTLHKRFFEPLPDGRFKEERIDPVKIEEKKSDYCSLKGWETKAGVPFSLYTQECERFLTLLVDINLLK